MYITMTHDLYITLHAYHPTSNILKVKINYLLNMTKKNEELCISSTYAR